MHVAIAGNIGSGKTTLTTLLAKHYGWQPHFEEVDENPYLNEFYDDMMRWSFNLQIYFLHSRFRQIHSFRSQNKNVIQDRTIYEDAIFAKTLMQQGMIDQRDYETYLELFKHMSHFMCRPSLIIYLDLTPERSLERIKMRARNVEAGIPMAYLELLHRGYEEFIADISRSIPVIRVPWEEFHETEEVVKLVQETYLKESFLREVHWRPSKA
mgnify:CR=1 FL=1